MTTKEHSSGRPESDADESSDCSIFLCYRQDDASELAAWLFQALNATSLPTTLEQPVPSLLSVYFDRTAAAVGDWRSLHAPALQTSRAILVICTPGAYARQGDSDWVHLEIDWWIKNRSSPPILIDPGKGEGRWVPETIKKRWPNAQRVTVDLDRFERSKPETQIRIRQQVVTQITRGVMLGASRYIFEELEKYKRYNRLIRGVSAFLFLALLAVGLLGYYYAHAKGEATFEASRARRAEIAADRRALEAAQTNAKLIQEKAATARSTSRTFLESARRSIAAHKPSEGLALLSSSWREDPSNLQSLGELMRLLLETRWFVPAVEPLDIGTDIHSVTISPQGTYVVLSLGDSWFPPNPSTGRLFRVTADHSLVLVGSVSSKIGNLFAFTEDEEYLVEVGYNEDTHKSYPTGKGWAIPTLAAAVTKRPFVVSTPPSTAALEIHENKVMTRKDGALGEPLLHFLPVLDAWASPSVRYVVTASGLGADLTVDFWHLGRDSSEHSRLIYTKDDVVVSGVSFSPGGHFVVLTSEGELSNDTSPPVARCYRRVGSNEVSEIDFSNSSTDFSNIPRFVSFFPDGQYALSVLPNNTLYTWKISDPGPEQDIADESGFEHDLPGGTRSIPIATLGDRVQEASVKTVSDSGRYMFLRNEDKWLLADTSRHKRTVLPIRGLIVEAVYFSSDEEVAAFQTGANPNVPDALNVVSLPDGHVISKHGDFAVDKYCFSKNKRFLLQTQPDGAISVYETRDLQLVGGYESPLLDQFWASESILDIDLSSRLTTLAEALAGKRVNEAGEITLVPPSEWLKLRGSPPRWPSVTARLIKWFEGSSKNRDSHF